MATPSLFYAGDAAEKRVPGDAAQTLLRECLRIITAGLRKAARTSSETASDLFEAKGVVSDADELDFLVKREAWVDRFVETFDELFGRRLSGQRRQGRRPDPDVSLSTLRVLNPYDQEKQAGIVAAIAAMHRWALKEVAALDLRVAELLDEPVVRDVDNPFGPDYIVDAVGASARAMFPNPRVWRPFMERVLSDLGPAVPKCYISANRLLADRGVLPEIKAALRARSDLRPDSDKELLPLFNRLLSEAGTAIENIDIEVPPVLPGAPPPPQEDAPRPQGHARAAQGGGAPAGESGDGGIPLIDLGLAGQLIPATRHAAVAATAEAWKATAHPLPTAAAEASPFPSLDPLLTLGTSSPVIAVLNQWQSFDPENAATREALAAGGIDVAALPLNRVPYLRLAIGQTGVSETDRITMDVIALLFDYIFRDPSIPASARGMFGRLQVPVLKAALIDRGFFSDRNHPARRLLDRFAAGAAGAASDKAYRIAFEGVAGRIVDRICKEYLVDLVVFERADEELKAFVDGEQRNLARALGDDIEAALSAESKEADRAHARALVRDRLAGLQLPADVRLFAESVWADYLTILRRDAGEDSEVYRTALGTLDDLLWSITAKERTAQKARLTKMVPRIIGALRKGCAAVKLAEDRAKTFFETLYRLHIAAIRQRNNPRPAMAVAVAGAGSGDPGNRGASAPARAAAPASTSTAGAPAGPPHGPDGDMRAAAGAAPAATPAQEPALAAVPPPAAAEPGSFGGTANYHDYVSEMPLGTWLAFATDNGWKNARLQWVSPLRTKYIFTTRSRGSAFLYAPEDLAWALSVGRARIVVEPVPLFDRAVSAAIDTLAAKKIA